ncbi:hypothetical protein SAMN05216548_101235 [Faunimonas pinastri]|uniref:Uncharacterized protein n=1 Tax=Faunimonas pinastri TaxID=1855383 RepID=A0A1H8ZT10_9HYPH|nr:hypothetical protein [Faunimonas pinastri]SEP67620.1 hypothetical protein SAMN05216548_101235 [Faunimonas pinastri]
METTDQEIEGFRIVTVEGILEDLEVPDVSALQERYGPGTFGCHEALHVSSIELQSVSDNLMSHPAVALNSEWYQLAYRAHEALVELYQAIGAEHLATEDEAEEA